MTMSDKSPCHSCEFKTVKDTAHVQFFINSREGILASQTQREKSALANREHENEKRKCEKIRKKPSKSEEKEKSRSKDIPQHSCSTTCIETNTSQSSSCSNKCRNKRGKRCVQSSSDTCVISTDSGLTRSERQGKGRKCSQHNVRSCSATSVICGEIDRKKRKNRRKKRKIKKHRIERGKIKSYGKGKNKCAACCEKMRTCLACCCVRCCLAFCCIPPKKKGKVAACSASCQTPFCFPDAKDCQICGHKRKSRSHRRRRYDSSSESERTWIPPGSARRSASKTPKEVTLNSLRAEVKYCKGKQPEACKRRQRNKSLNLDKEGDDMRSSRHRGLSCHLRFSDSEPKTRDSRSRTPSSKRPSSKQQSPRSGTRSCRRRRRSSFPSENSRKSATAHDRKSCSAQSKVMATASRTRSVKMLPSRDSIRSVANMLNCKRSERELSLLVRSLIPAINCPGCPMKKS